MSTNRYTTTGRREIHFRQEQPIADARIQVSSQGAGFGAPQASFNFGASAPAPSNDSGNLFGFGSNSAFGGGSTNSFPPAQSSAPSNSFLNSSFPAFGGSSNQNNSFNPQPSTTDFNFTAGNNNPFAKSDSTPALNGNVSSAPAFGAFGAQSSSNPFSTLGPSNTTASAAGGLFSTTSGPPQTGLFGTPQFTSSSHYNHIYSSFSAIRFRRRHFVCSISHEYTDNEQPLWGVRSIYATSSTCAEQHLHRIRYQCAKK